VAPPIQEEDSLFLPLHRARHRLEERAAEMPRRLGTFATARPLAEIREAHDRERAPVDALRKAEQRRRAARGLRVGLEARRCGAEKRRRAEALGADERDVAGVVARRLVLFVGAVLLFVHDHEPEIRERKENGGAGAHDDVELAGRGLPPDVGPLARTKLAVVERGARDAGAAERVERLGRQVDLRHERHHLTAASNRLERRVQIDGGLAAPRDAEEEERFEGALRDRCFDPLERRPLVIVQRVTRRRVGGLPRMIVERDRAGLSALPRGHRGRRRAEDLAQARGVVARDPAAERDQLLGQRDSGFVDARDRTHRDAARRLGHGLEHGAPDTTPPQRHEHPQTRLRHLPFGKRVDVALVLGDGNRDSNQAHRGRVAPQRAAYRAAWTAAGFPSRMRPTA
jgi:hypothetical protein